MMNKRILLLIALVCVVVLGFSRTYAQNDVTFQVDMRIKMLEGTFLPASGDIVTVPGTINGWNNSADTLTDGDADSIYTITKALTEGDTISYKFFKTLRGGSDWEGDPNRSYVVVAGAQSIPVVYFDRDSVYTPPSTDQPVTFQVNMKIKMLEGSFRPDLGDVVAVPGSMNGWNTSANPLGDGDGDSIYTATLNIPEGDIHYKFYKTLRGASDWESDPNRDYTVIPGGAQSIPVAYFDRDTVYNPPTSDVPVKFQVNMRIKMLEGIFLPDSGDIVRVAGSFNAWGSSTDTLTDPDNDSIYTKTINLAENTSIQYKFLKTLRGTIDWEDHIGGNRQLNIPTGGIDVPVALFDGDSLVSVPTTANILWQVDMTLYEQLGWFRPDLGDSVEVRGAFNSWGGTKMDPNPFVPHVYEVLMPYSGVTYDILSNKYFMDLDSATAVDRFPTYNSTTQDEIRYDHPADHGDGNRQFNVGLGGDISSGLIYFSSINPQGLIPTGDTVDVTLQLNTGDATRYAVPFNPATDTLKIIWGDGLTKAVQTKLQGAFPDVIMSPVSPGDSIYTGTIRIVGPTHYGMLYRYRYIQPGGTAVDQEGGLGGDYLYYSRFIQPTFLKASARGNKVVTAWPRNYTAPVDTWKKSSPYVAEVPPFDIVNGVNEEPSLGVAKEFKLAQNFPNPFNPMTRIRYTIPEKANVTLKVYNLIGQEVATLVNQDQQAGNYVALFEANSLASGIYFYKLQAGSFTQVKKMVLMK